MGWNYLSIHKLQRLDPLNFSNLVIHLALHNGWNYLSTLGLKLIHVSKRGPSSQYVSIPQCPWTPNYGNSRRGRVSILLVGEEITGNWGAVCMDITLGPVSGEYSSNPSIYSTGTEISYILFDVNCFKQVNTPLSSQCNYYRISRNSSRPPWPVTHIATWISVEEWLGGWHTITWTNIDLWFYGIDMRANSQEISPCKMNEKITLLQKILLNLLCACESRCQKHIVYTGWKHISMGKDSINPQSQGYDWLICQSWGLSEKSF